MRYQKIYTSLLFLAFAINALAEDVTVQWDFTAQNFSNQQDLNGYQVSLDDKVSIALSQSTGQNTPKYYTSGASVRLYPANTLTVNGQGIKQIMLVFGSDDKNNEISANTGTYETNGTWTGSADKIVFTVGGSSGHRRIAAVTVTYASGVPAPPDTVITIPTVTSIAAFKKLDEGAVARLQLADNMNARVLYKHGDETYLRDRTGAICLKMPDSLYNPMPVHNQHVAGFIIGQFHSENGLPQLLPTDSTTTEYLLFAEPVSEPDTKPESVDVEEFGAYYADWVTLSDMRVENDGATITLENDDLYFEIRNRFGLTEDDQYTEPQNKALVNVTGIAIPEGNKDIVAPVCIPPFLPIEILEAGGLKGDVNLDGKVDINDVVAVINIMAGNNSMGCNGDVNEDGHTDINDVVAIINIMAGNDVQVADRNSADFSGIVIAGLESYLPAIRKSLVRKDVPEGMKEVAVTVKPADAPSDSCVHAMTIWFVNDSAVSYAREDIDTVTYVPKTGMKIHLTYDSVAVDYLYSQMQRIDYVFVVPDIVEDENKNANWKEFDLSSAVSGNLRYAYRLEYPHLNANQYSSSNKGGSQVVVKETGDYGITYSLEWDNAKIANRWTCYTMHAGNMYSNVKRDDAFQPDPDVATSSQLSDYSGSGFSRGHLCPSADRLCSREQNSQTFYLTNMQPQWQAHNGGLWERMEAKIRDWAGNCDTLYVVKAATISDVEINGNTEAGVYDQRCNNRLLVPKYFYMAVLSYKKATNQYRALALWTLHQNATDSNMNYGDYAITIDELERRTGIDFFCNLPDSVEDDVEATVSLNYWGIQTSGAKERNTYEMALEQ